MGGVAQQRDRAMGPARQRIAVNHRIDPHHRRRANQRRGVQPVKSKVFEGRQKILKPPGTIPVFAFLERGRVKSQLGHEIDLLRSRPGGRVADGVADEFCPRVAGHDHRVSVQHAIELRDAAPHHRSVPARRPLAGIQYPPRGGMDSIARHEQAPVRRDALPAGCAVNKSRADATAGLGVESSQLATRMQSAAAETLFDSLQEQEVKSSAVYGNLRPAVPGGKAPRLAPDALTPLGEIGELAARDTGALDRLAQPQLFEFPHGVGKHVEAHPQRLNLGDGLEHLHGEPGGVQAQGGCKSADSGAGNYDFVAGWHPRVAISGVKTVMERIERFRAAVPNRLARKFRSIQGAVLT